MNTVRCLMFIYGLRRDSLKFLQGGRASLMRFDGFAVPFDWVRTFREW